ncbi:MAG: biopolymer transport protein ExbD [Gammaproteobacteria bacterium]|jgi:biopolymer transport protein ExbD
MVSPYSLPVDLPNGKNKNSEVQSVSFRIGADLVYAVGNEIIDRSEIESALTEALSTKKDKSIILNIDKNVPSGDMVEVLGIAKRNKWKIVVATKPQ